MIGIHNYTIFSTALNHTDQISHTYFNKFLYKSILSQVVKYIYFSKSYFKKLRVVQSKSEQLVSHLPITTNE